MSSVRVFVESAVAIGVAALLSASAPTEGVWKDESGRPARETESQKSSKNFGGWLVVTSDADWKEKWQTPPETTPHFTTADTVKKGERLWILIFFVNPGVDAEHNADVTCNIQTIRPDGSFSIDQKNVVCFRGKVEGDPHILRLAAPVIGYVGEEKDPMGKWQVRVTLKDNRRQVGLPLKTSFTLK